MNPTFVASTLTAALGVVIATTFELLPERVDPLQFSLTLAGAGSLFGIGFAAARKAGAPRRARYSELGSLYGAGAGLLIALVGYLVQELG